MSQGKISLNNMCQRDMNSDGARHKSTNLSDEIRTGPDRPVQERSERPKGDENHGSTSVYSARDIMLPDDASDTSDLIPSTMLDVKIESTTPKRAHQIMPDSPISVGVDSEDDFLCAFPAEDGPFCASSFGTSERLPTPDVVVLQKQLQNLRATIRTLRTEKQLAEEQAVRAMERVTEMKELQQQAMNETTRKTGGTVDDLQEQNRLLQEQLNDAQSHIFSLQPYRKDLTPEEIGLEFDGMIEKVQDWVQKLMGPYLDDHAHGVHQVLSMARKNAAETAHFKRALQAQPDLVHASVFPETDEDIIAALVLRYLQDSIFQKILYGDLDNYTEVLSIVETHMQVSVEPKRDLFSIRSWTAEAYNALLSASQFQKIRDRARRRLTMGLAYKLKVLCKKADWEAFCQDVSEACIRPAMQLYEKMQTSTHHFYLDINPMMTWRRDGNLATSQEFYESISKLDCRNVLQHRKGFNLAKICPEPSPMELSHRLLNICTVVPALYMRQVGQRDTIKEPTLVRKQQTLVAWGTEEARHEFLQGGERTIAAHLWYLKEKVYPWV